MRFAICGRNANWPGDRSQRNDGRLGAAGEDMKARRFVTVCTLFIGAAAAAQDLPSARFGVLAYRGVDAFRVEWSGFEAHLDRALPDWKVEFVPITLESADGLLRNGALEFLITNPGHYVELARDHALSPLATRVRRTVTGDPVTYFGSVIITSQDGGIRQVTDIEGARLYAVAPDAFGGFQIAWQTFHEKGIELRHAPTDTVFTGFPMDQVIENVLADPGSIGIVRSGMIERLAASGQLEPDALRILNGNTTFTHPESISTAVFPEWPLLSTATADRDLVLEVMRLAIWQGDGGVRNSSWTAPLPYDDVRALLGEFEEPVSSPFRRVWWLYALSLLGLVAVLLLMLFRKRKHDHETIGDTEPLTRRQRQILSLVTEGKTSKEIASDIGLSVKTVEFHRANLLRKFGVSSSAELVSKLSGATPGENQG